MYDLFNKMSKGWVPGWFELESFVFDVWKEYLYPNEVSIRYTIPMTPICQAKTFRWCLQPFDDRDPIDID